MADNIARYGFRLFTGSFSSVGVSGPPVYPAIVASNYDSNQANAVGTAGVGFHVGDIVNQLADGSVKHVGVGTNATQANQPLAVVMGIDPVFDVSIGQVGAMSKKNFLPAGIVYGTNLERQSKLLVVPMVGNLWEVDVNDNTTATTLAAYQAFIGENANLVYSAVAPNAFPRLNISGHAVTATLQFRIVRVSPTLDNLDFTGANVKLLVTPTVVQDAPFTAVGI